MIRIKDKIINSKQAWKVIDGRISSIVGWESTYNMIDGDR